MQRVTRHRSLRILTQEDRQESEAPMSRLQLPFEIISAISTNEKNKRDEEETDRANKRQRGASPQPSPAPQAPPARTRNMGKGKGVGKGVGVGMGMGSPPPVGRKSLSLHAECVPMLSPLQLLHPTHTQGEDSFSPTSPFSAHSETCVTEVTCDTEMSTETEVDEVEVEEECEVDVSVELSAPTLPNAIWCLPLPSLSLLAEEAQEAQAERALCAGVSLDRSAGEQPLISEFEQGIVWVTEYAPEIHTHLRCMERDPRYRLTAPPACLKLEQRSSLINMMLSFSRRMGFVQGMLHLAVSIADRYFHQLGSALPQYNPPAPTTAPASPEYVYVAGPFHSIASPPAPAPMAPAPQSPQRFSTSTLLHAGCAALWIAFKFEEHSIDFNMDAFLRLASGVAGAPTMPSLVTYEHKILVALQYDIIAPTMHAFLSRYVPAAAEELAKSQEQEVKSQEGREGGAQGGVQGVQGAEAGSQVPDLGLVMGSTAHCVCERALLAEEALKFLPSEVAAAAVYLSVGLVRRSADGGEDVGGRGGRAWWGPAMVKVTGYTEVQLQPAARALQLVFAQETYARSRRFAHALLELQLPLFGQQAQGQAQGRGGVQGGQGCVQYTYSSLICTITRLLTDSDTGAGTNLSAPTVPTVSPALQLYQGYLPGILEHLEGEILTDPSAALQHVPTHSEKHDESDSESLGSVGSLTQETTSGAPSPMPQSLSKQVSSSPCTQYTQGTLGTHTTAETAETAESKVSWGSRRSGRPQRAVAMPPQLQDKYRVFHVDQALLLFPSNTSTHCSDPSNPSAKGPQSILDACILQVSRLPPLFDTVKHRYPSIYSKLITCPP